MTDFLTAFILGLLAVWFVPVSAMSGLIQAPPGLIGGFVAGYMVGGVGRGAVHGELATVIGAVVLLIVWAVFGALFTGLFPTFFTEIPSVTTSTVWHQSYPVLFCLSNTNRNALGET